MKIKAKAKRETGKVITFEFLKYTETSKELNLRVEKENGDVEDIPVVLYPGSPLPIIGTAVIMRSVKQPERGLESFYEPIFGDVVYKPSHMINRSHYWETGEDCQDPDIYDATNDYYHDDEEEEEGYDEPEEEEEEDVIEGQGTTVTMGTFTRRYRMNADGILEDITPTNEDERPPF